MLKFFCGSNPSGPDSDATTGNNTHENFAILLLLIRRVNILKSFKVYFLSRRSEYIFNIFLLITLSHVLKYHRIVEGLSLDGMSLEQAMSICISNISMNGDSTHSLGNLFQHSTILMGKRKLLYLNRFSCIPFVPITCCPVTGQEPGSIFFTHSIKSLYTLVRSS